MSRSTLEAGAELSRSVCSLLEAWGVAPADQVAMLGLPDGTRPRAMRRFREGTPLPDDRAVMERVEHIVEIADALRTMFPGHPEMGRVWLRRRNRHFRKRSPLATMVSGGVSGLIAVRSRLDCTYAWDLTGSRA